MFINKSTWWRKIFGKIISPSGMDILSYLKVLLISTSTKMKSRDKVEMHMKYEMESTLTDNSPLKWNLVRNHQLQIHLSYSPIETILKMKDYLGWKRQWKEPKHASPKWNQNITLPNYKYHTNPLFHLTLWFSLNTQKLIWLGSRTIIEEYLA